MTGTTLFPRHEIVPWRSQEQSFASLIGRSPVLLVFFWELTSVALFLLIGYWHHDEYGAGPVVVAGLGLELRAAAVVFFG